MKIDYDWLIQEHGFGEYFKCSVCFNVVQEPICCNQCEQLICATCKPIKDSCPLCRNKPYKLMKVPRIIQQQINELSFQHPPCKQILQIKNKYQHECIILSNHLVQAKLTIPEIGKKKWATKSQGLDYPTGLAIYDGYIYVCNSKINTISKISIYDPKINFQEEFANKNQGLSQPWAIAISQQYMYICNYKSDTIAKISLDDPKNDFVPVWASFKQGLNGPTGITISTINYSSSDLYAFICNQKNDTISKISLKNPRDDWIGEWLGLESPIGISSNSNWIVITNQANSAIYSTGTLNPINDFKSNCCMDSYMTNPHNDYVGIAYSGTGVFATTKTPAITLFVPNHEHSTKHHWADEKQGLDDPEGIAVFGEHVYVCNFGNHTISKINISRPNYQE